MVVISQSIVSCPIPTVESMPTQLAPDLCHSVDFKSIYSLQSFVIWQRTTSSRNGPDSTDNESTYYIRSSCALPTSTDREGLGDGQCYPIHQGICCRHSRDTTYFRTTTDSTGFYMWKTWIIHKLCWGEFNLVPVLLMTYFSLVSRT